MVGNISQSLCEDHPRHHKVPAMGTEVDINNTSKQVWLGLDYPGHHHGQEVAVA